MPNAWVEHVRDWAKRNKLSYACSVGKPKCRQEYYDKIGVASPARKKKTKKVNEE